VQRGGEAFARASEKDEVLLAGTVLPGTFAIDAEKRPLAPRCQLLLGILGSYRSLCFCGHSGAAAAPALGIFGLTAVFTFPIFGADSLPLFVGHCGPVPTLFVALP
jgi:hypothetical protein